MPDNTLLGAPFWFETKHLGAWDLNLKKGGGQGERFAWTKGVSSVPSFLFKMLCHGICGRDWQELREQALTDVAWKKREEWRWGRDFGWRPQRLQKGGEQPRSAEQRVGLQINGEVDSGVFWSMEVKEGVVDWDSEASREKVKLPLS